MARDPGVEIYVLSGHQATIASEAAQTAAQAS